ncbi:MAG: hypothetical protein Q8R44_19805 [Novosphingobium sp.]|nr:hypothetical protein [Novosphingobium sp.]
MKRFIAAFALLILFGAGVAYAGLEQRQNDTGTSDFVTTGPTQNVYPIGRTTVFISFGNLNQELSMIIPVINNSQVTELYCTLTQVMLGHFAIGIAVPDGRQGTLGEINIFRADTAEGAAGSVRGMSQRATRGSYVMLTNPGSGGSAGTAACVVVFDSSPN